MSEGLVIALTAGIVALVNGIPAWRMNDKVKEILQKIGILEKHMVAENDIDKIKQRFCNIIAFYSSKITNEDCKNMAISKSENYLTNVVIFTLKNLNLNDVTHFNIFMDRYKAASRASKARMIELVGEEMTNQYYDKVELEVVRYLTIVQKIFFANSNSKSERFVSASIDFMQVFIEDIIMLCGDSKDCFKNRLHREEDHK